MRKQPVSIRRMVVPIAVLLIAILVTLVSIMRSHLVADNAKLQAELDRINRNLHIGRSALDQSQTLEDNIAKLTTETEMIQGEYALIAGKGQLDDIIRFITDNLPANTNYTDITSNAKEIVIEGITGDRQNVLDVAGTLAKSGKFAEVRITSIDQAKSGTSPEDMPRINFGIIIDR